MRISLVSTEKIVIVNGLPCRVWEGQSAAGVHIYCYIPRVHVNPEEIPVNKQTVIKEMGGHLQSSPALAKMPGIVNYDTAKIIANSEIIDPNNHYESNV